MPDFKFELFPLHSPLLGESLLVSFPPLIDMLKFSGYSYLIRGQPLKIGCFMAREIAPDRSEKIILRSEDTVSPPLTLRRCVLPQPPNNKLCLGVEMTLEQACPLEY